MSRPIVLAREETHEPKQVEPSRFGTSAVMSSVVAEAMMTGRCVTIQLARCARRHRPLYALMGRLDAPVAHLAGGKRQTHLDLRSPLPRAMHNEFVRLLAARDRSSRTSRFGRSRGRSTHETMSARRAIFRRPPSGRRWCRRCTRARLRTTCNVTRCLMSSPCDRRRSRKGDVGRVPTQHTQFQRQRLDLTPHSTVMCE